MLRSSPDCRSAPVIDMRFPEVYRVRQHVRSERVDDIPGTVRDELRRIDIGARIGPGQTVAIPVGSRGIANIALIIRSVCESVREAGGVPILIPAMGSHGGGTAEGQRKIIEKYGVTEAYCDAEIRASMETVVVAQTDLGFPVHFDRHAYECDHVLVVGRVKPHTGFVGPVESGLHKMMLIGLGKHAGAEVYHRAILDYDFETIIRTVGEVVLRECNVIGGLAIVENANDETGRLTALEPQNFFDGERELLRLATDWLPALPFPDVDVLVVDRIGKDISGTGLDTNTVGRKFHDHKATPEDRATVRRILIRGLTEASMGNGNGIGIAEFTTERCVAQIDPEVTRINGVTGGHPSAGAIPLTYPDDRSALAAALSCAGLAPPAELRLVQIADTLHLSEVLVGTAYAERIAARDDLEILSGPEPLAFDATGHLADVFPS